MENSERFFRNTECRYFPCHKDVGEEDFNCLFCYCPLYLLGEKCGGDYVIKNGVKSCITCTRPHDPANYENIIRKVASSIKKP
ncbi:MAG: metal-binding protein [Lachnospiraceae bacterium]|nr:metal-binding protein [Lachnospiraceae bacterium]